MGLVAAAGAVCIAATSCRWTGVLSPCLHWDAVLVCQKIHHVKLRQLHMYCIFLPVLCTSTVMCRLEVLHSKLTGILLCVHVSSLSGWSFGCWAVVGMGNRWWWLRITKKSQSKATFTLTRTLTHTNKYKNWNSLPEDVITVHPLKSSWSHWNKCPYPPPP